MASAFAHVFAAASLGVAVVPHPRARVIVAGIVCSVLPDVDVAGLSRGIAYGDPFGHRGITHSLVFAAIVAGAVGLLFFRDRARSGSRARITAYLFIATASHGLFDASTNGGLGVAFLAPFDATRWFLPFRPVLVSPIGVGEFFTSRAGPILESELVWIVVPWSALCIVLAASVRAFDASRRGRGQ